MPNKKRQDKSFSRIYDRFYNYVPCNTCEECESQNRDSYATRAVFHLKYILAHGGVCFYYTLTYNDDHIPRYKGIPCFDSKIVQKFLKRLRKEFPSRSLSYLVSSEVGDNTFRPHHHCLFYLNFPLSSTSFYKLVEKHWRQGFIYPGHNNGLVNSVIPCRYVSKYISKDKNYLEYLQNYNITPEFLEEFEEFKAVSKDSRQFRPPHFQSIGFGSSMSNYIRDIDYINGYVVINDAEEVNHKYPIPLYIIRKTLYDIDKNSKGNVVYKLNEYGVKIKSSQIEYKIESKSLDFETLFYQSEYMFYQIPQLVKEFKSFDNWRDYVYTVLHGACDFQDLASYYVLYHDLPHLAFSFSDLKKDIDKYLHGVLYNSKDMPFEENLQDSDYYRYFSGYDDLIRCLTYVKQKIAYDSYVERTRTYNIEQRYRSMNSGIKPKYIRLKCFNEFINSKFNRLCSITSLRKDANSLKILNIAHRYLNKSMTLFP